LVSDGVNSGRNGRIAPKRDGATLKRTLKRKGEEDAEEDAEEEGGRGR